jgi:hypothetical protein
MDKHSHLGDNLGIKYCARSPPGVLPRRGINMNPGCMLLYSHIFTTNRLYAKPSSPLVVSSSSSRGFIDPSTSVSTGNLVSCLVSCGGFRS